MKPWLTALSILLMGSMCHTQANRCFPNENRQIANTPGFLTGVEDFGLSMFKRLVQEKPGSIFVSPYSLWSVLSLAYFGSAGNTQRQLAQALNLNTKSETFRNWNILKFMLQPNPRSNAGARFNSVNRAYFSKDLTLERCLNTILFDMRSVDFRDGTKARDLINRDINITTEGYIPQFIQFLPPSTQFALINAVFFKGLWQFPFDESKTRPQEFLIPPGISAGVVQMMVNTGFYKHVNAPSLGASILELPYDNSSVSMYVILPDSWETDGVIELLSQQALAEILPTMKKVKVELGLPTFKMTSRLEGELKSALLSMGIVDLFEAGVANLTAFTKTNQIWADQAIHEATVEVTPKGTVAAAASGLINTRFGGPKATFICNRPFIFMIRDKKTNITLFAGKYEHPDHTEAL